MMRLVVLVAALVASSATAHAEPALRTLRWPPFSTVMVSIPDGSAPVRDTLILLHGNQGSPPDPAWLVELRRQPGFDRRILIVPALGGYDWDRPAHGRALAALVAELARTLPIDPRRTFLVGYSAGASRVLAVAHHLRLRGVIAVAGDVLRDHGTAPPELATLLVCMSSDDGPHTSCALNERNRAALARRGVRDLTLRRLPGDHRLDLTALAPLVDEWLRARSSVKQ